jgi:orotate phosphoribosyltransferase
MALGSDQPGDDTAQVVADILVRLGAVAFRTDPFFTFTSGTRSPIYVDNRLLLGHPAERRTIVGGLAGLLDGQRFDVVAGTATAGIPWAAWLADRYDVPLLYVRGSKKPHGHQKSIEGDAPGGSHVVVVEDLLFTAGSLTTTVEELRAAGHVVPGSVAIASYQTTAAAQRVADLGITSQTLTTIDTTIEVAAKLDVLTPEQRTIVADWLTQARR